MEIVEKSETQAGLLCPSKPFFKPIKFQLDRQPLDSPPQTPSMNIPPISQDKHTKKPIISFLKEKHSQMKLKKQALGKENAL